MTDQPQDPKQTVAELFDRASASYEQVGVAFFDRFGARLVELSALQPGQRVLDVGCGTGSVLLPAATAVGERGEVIGIDLSEGMLAQCRRRVDAAGLSNATLRVGDAERPDVASASIDVVLAGLVLFFLPDPLAALRS